jgi:hypothetical protein
MTQQIKNWQEDSVAFAERMEENAWYGAELSRYTDNYHAIDVRKWVHDNCTGEYNSFGRYWVFKQSADAVMFKLRWA